MGAGAGVDPGVDPDSISEVPAWKAKKWAAHILLRMLQRYGNTRYARDDGQRALAKFLLANYAARCLQATVGILLLKSSGQPCAPRVETLCFNFVGEAISHTSLYRTIHPQLETLLVRACAWRPGSSMAERRCRRGWRWTRWRRWWRCPARNAMAALARSDMECASAIVTIRASPAPSFELCCCRVTRHCACARRTRSALAAAIVHRYRCALSSRSFASPRASSRSGTTTRLSTCERSLMRLRSSTRQRHAAGGGGGGEGRLCGRRCDRGVLTYAHTHLHSAPIWRHVVAIPTNTHKHPQIPTNTHKYPQIPALLPRASSASPARTDGRRSPLQTCSSTWCARSRRTAYSPSSHSARRPSRRPPRPCPAGRRPRSGSATSPLFAARTVRRSAALLCADWADWAAAASFRT